MHFKGVMAIEDIATLAVIEAPKKRGEYKKAKKIAAEKLSLN